MPTSSFARSRPLVLGLAGLGLVGALAGCSTSGSGGSDAAGGSSSGGSSSDGSSGSGSSGPYRDGTYTADGSYTAPSGEETITVTLTIADDKVTDVKIGKHATDPNAVHYQTDFADGIASQVVGKDVDALGVSRVSGSSLTSGGFRKALESIKQKAADS